MKLVLLSISTLLLAACGGGSTSNKETPITPPPEPLPIKQVVKNAINAFDDNVAINQAVELFLYYPQTEINNIQWNQLSGEPVTFLTPNSKGIAFTPTSSGNYVFEASFTTENGNTETLTHELDVTDSVSSISARLGHVVSEGNKVSLRTSLASNLPINTISWKQTSGPQVTLTDTNTSGKTAIFFNAPNVEQDSFVTFEVTATNTNTIYRDTVAVLIENKNEINNNALFDERVSDTFAYNPDSPYKNSLVDCVYNNNITINSNCTLNKLPLIAHDTVTPSIDDIMDRVVVSHQWMGDRFKTFLEQYDIHNDLKNMLRATTAIVISYDIRPSFYWGATGAIYLDPDNFWLTPEERDTLNEAPDYRASFGNDLQFDIPWRYVRNNDYLSTYISEDTRRSRNIDDGVYRAIGLMYHELAHANDFFPKSRWFTLDKSKRINAAITSPIQSDILSQMHPLNGNEMRALAQVSFHGASATPTQKSYTPQDIAHFFSPEVAPQYYNYSSIREDYAMLFDGFMMKARYNIDRDVAITNQVNAGGSASDYIVEWGQRGRISDENIKPRVAFVVERILPEFNDFHPILDNLPAPIAMASGKSWIDNLDISPSSAPKSLAKAQVSSQTRAANQNRPINEFRLLFEEKAMPTK
ncbi:hypothetical protein [Pseudocolwellia agarivorans]|uniref:hypothetical protein n=1 Tax=Pseudocolwellia agarivorans TaxID=1911682 RepID=UPI0009878C1F|nr:hypothetical protein [Pseudocolwellia agarivorans]